MLQPKPMILSFNSNPDVYVSKLVPTDDRISTRDEINNWQSKYPLPAFEDKCFSYSPFGIVITSKNPISNSNGWKVTHSTYWSDTLKKYKQEIISSRINNVIRRRDSAQKIGRDWSFFKQHVEEVDGEKSTIHYCLSAWFVEVNGVEGIACDFVRKVRSASSIQDELNMGFLPNGEGYSDVMVTVD